MKQKKSLNLLNLAYAICLALTCSAFSSCKPSKTAFVSSTQDISKVTFAGFNVVQIFSPGIAKGDAKIWMDVDGLNEISVNEFVELVNSDNGVYYRGCYMDGCRYERATKKMKSTYMGCYLKDKYVYPRVVLFKKKEVEQMKSLTISNDEERKCFCQMVNNSSVVQTAVRNYDQREENSAYQYAMSGNSISNLQYFLNKYPASQYKNKVNDKIKELDRIEKSKREAEEVAAKAEAEKKSKLVREKGADYVYSSKWTSTGLIGERQECDLIFADDTRAKIELGPTGVYNFWASGEQIYYETESTVTRAVYQWKKNRILSNIGRAYPEFAEKSNKCLEVFEKYTKWKESTFTFGGNEYKPISSDLVYKFKCGKNSKSGIFVNLIYNTESKSFWDNTDYQKGWYFYDSGFLSTDRRGPYSTVDEAVNKTCDCK